MALLVAPAAALAPNFGPTAPALDGMPGIGKETGDKAWDPYGFSLKASSETLGWFRAAEIKHGRVAMLAFTGFCVQGAGLGNIPLTPGAAPLSSKPFEALGQVPAAGIAQIVMTIGLIELYSESVKPHYTQGGQPGYLPIIAPSGLADGGVDLRAANKELKNGRLAMIGVMGFFAAAAVPGSVPALGAYAASEGPSSGGGRLGPSPAAPIIVVFVSDALGPRRSYPGLCALGGRSVGGLVLSLASHSLRLYDPKGHVRGPQQPGHGGRERSLRVGQREGRVPLGVGRAVDEQRGAGRPGHAVSERVEARGRRDLCGNQTSSAPVHSFIPLTRLLDDGGGQGEGNNSQ